MISGMPDPFAVNAPLFVVPRVKRLNETGAGATGMPAGVGKIRLNPTRRRIAEGAA